MIDETSSLEDVCFAVSGALQREDISAVLTGGSAASLYAPASYMSADADFIFDRAPLADTLKRALATIGFVPSPSSGMYCHSKSRFTLDFPRGPLAVGGDYVTEIAERKRGKILLRVLTPGDCVRDRLAHFFHWNDFTALNAAVAVACSKHGRSLDTASLRAWTTREGRAACVDFTAKLAEFERRVRERS